MNPRDIHTTPFTLVDVLDFFSLCLMSVGAALVACWVVEYVIMKQRKS